MLAFYSLGYEGCMRLPIRAFWLLCNQIARIEADQDQRKLRIALSQNNAEAAKELAAELADRIGEVVKVSAQARLMNMEFDREGFEVLRALQG